MTMDWRGGFAKQAASDFHVFKILCKISDIPVCHRLHYLQMATEKMAKAFLTSPNATKPPRTVHEALLPFIRNAKKGGKEFNQLYRFFHPNGQAHPQFEAYLASIENFASEIQKLAPRGGSIQEPNPEYPWEQADTDPNIPGTTRWVLKVPCQEKFLQFNLLDFKTIKFMKFVETCIRFLESEK